MIPPADRIYRSPVNVPEKAQLDTGIIDFRIIGLVLLFITAEGRGSVGKDDITRDNA
jgi:hypothetical protein